MERKSQGIKKEFRNNYRSHPGCNTESMARAGSNRLHTLFQIKMMYHRALVLFKPAIPTALPQKTV